MTTMQHLSEKAIELWNNWEIRGMVLLSLLLQIILVIFGSRRKYIARTWIRIPIWSAYLLADIVATYALSNLARSQGDSEHSFAKSNNQIKAFWAPFLLLHLGGPDTITAYSIEDNELWIRHLLNLVIQIGVAFYVLIRSWGSTSTLRYLAIPMFVTGMIKYGERNWVLMSSTSKSITDSLNYRSLDEHRTVFPPNSELRVFSYLLDADFLFKRTKYLFQDQILGSDQLKKSHEVISDKSSEEAFKLVEVELGFMYNMLCTKAPIIYSYLGIFLRCICFLSSLMALVAFSIIINKHAYTTADIVTTYILLIGALVLEVYAFLSLILSDKMMIWLTTFGNSPTNSICGVVNSLRTHLTNDKRWSRSIAQHNLISYCLKTKSAEWAEKLGIEEMLKHLYINWTDVNTDLKDKIFRQLQEKGNQVRRAVNDAELDLSHADVRFRLVALRGDGVLEERQDFLWSISGVEFNQSLFTWHIASDLCYYHDLANSRDVNNLSSKSKISKCLSDYMCYLLAMRPDMLPKGIGDSGNRYRSTCAMVKEIFKNYEEATHDEGTACEFLYMAINQEAELDWNRAFGPMEDPTAVPYAMDGLKLARQLQSLEFEEKWAMISEVWIEMLAYAASHCGWREHAQQLRRGGELLTHVCLLMAHLGLSQQYEYSHLIQFEIEKPIE